MEEPKVTLNEMLSEAAGNEPVVKEITPPEGEVTPPEGEDPLKPGFDTDVKPIVIVEPAVPIEDPNKPGFDMEGKPVPVVKPPKPNPMKDVRDKLNTEKKQREFVVNTMNKFAAGSYTIKLTDHMLEDGSGIDYESFNKAMEDVDLAVKAEAKGLTPEVQAAIDKIEKDKVEIQKERLQIAMDKALTNLQIANNLKQADINNFFKDAMENKKNPYQWIAQGGTLDDLYRLVYADKIKQTDIDAAVAAAKTKWEADAIAAGKIPKVNPGVAAVKSSGVKDGKTMKELLAEAAANQK